MDQRRIVMPLFSERPLPLYAESIGHNPAQEPINRSEGYPVYHWLQTDSGEGLVHLAGRSELLTPGKGILFAPGQPHAYEAHTDTPWQTYYFTFSGSAAQHMITALPLPTSLPFVWEAESPFSPVLQQMLARAETESDVFGLHASLDVYRFLLTLWKFGQPYPRSGISRSLQQIEPLLHWMEASLSNADISLDTLAQEAGLSPRRLNTIFRDLFGISPYAYLIKLRLRRSQELLIGQPGRSVSSIAQQVGFREASYFIATFRKAIGVSPEKFRQL